MGSQEGVLRPCNLGVPLQVGRALVLFQLPPVIHFRSSSTRERWGETRRAAVERPFHGRKHRSLTTLWLRSGESGMGELDPCSAGGGTERGRSASRCRVEMTGTCFFTFFFLLSFLCFIKGNTKGKLCYLLKHVRVHFKREEKEQARCCLDRGGSAGRGRLDAAVVGGVLQGRPS